MIQKTMLEEDNISIESTNSVKRRINFAGEAALMTEEDKFRKLACTKLKRDERLRRKSLGLPEDFVFQETFSNEDIERALHIMANRRSTRNNPQVETEEQTGDESGPRNGGGNAWGVTRGFQPRSRAPGTSNDQGTNDQGLTDERSSASRTGSTTEGTNDSDDSSTRSTESDDDSLDDDMATLTREQLLRKCVRQQEELDELKRKLDDELGGHSKKKRRKQLPEPKDRAEKLLAKDMKIVLRTYIIHHVSNQPKH
jgi:hypothetical protein